jgi:hypothetical protein
VSAVDYDPTRLDVQWLDGATWTALDAATVTIAAGYDVGDTGVLLIGPETCTVTMSYRDTTTTDPLVLGRRVRVRYDGSELFIGLVADLTRTFTAAAGRSQSRTDLSASIVSRIGEAMARPKTWGPLPFEAASTRLERFGATVDLNGAEDINMVAEEAGSSTMLELIRAFSVAIGKPVRMTSDTAVSVVTDPLTLPSGYSDADAAGMYASATHTASAGARVLSIDPGDETFSASAVLVTDDIQLLLSDWQLPQALPVPFADSALTSRWSVTLTPKHATGTLDFVTATANIVRPRPPAPYLTGGKPWDPARPYPTNALVTYDGHLWRAPAPLTGLEPGAIPAPHAVVELTDTDHGTDATFTAIVSAEILDGRPDIYPTYPDGIVQYTITPAAGQTAGRGTAVGFYVVTEDDVEVLWEAFMSITSAGLGRQGYFSPEGWDYDSDHGSGNAHYATMWLRQWTRDEPPTGGSLAGPVVATYPFADVIPTWVQVV